MLCLQLNLHLCVDLCDTDIYAVLASTTTAMPCRQLSIQPGHARSYTHRHADSAPVRAEDPTPSPGRCAPLPSAVVGAVGDVAGVAVPGRRLTRLRTESAGAHRGSDRAPP
jgi:hypothetical protein